MPSVDYAAYYAPDLTQKNKDVLDLDVIKEICDKYGFKYTFINSTFGGSREVCFVVYLKTDIDVDEYGRLSKNLSNLTKEEKEYYWSFSRRYRETYQKLHDCIHELDEKTDLYFRTGWVGNCGQFGSDDVRRISYSGANGLMSWRNVTSHWDSYIYDTRYKLSKGVYVLEESRYLKTRPENSPALEESEPKFLEEVRNLIGENYTAEFEEGKRLCDTDSTSYRALIVRYKKSKDYCGMIRFHRNLTGQYIIDSAAPLCGECSWVMDWEHPTEDLKAALRFTR